MKILRKISDIFRRNEPKKAVNSRVDPRIPEELEKVITQEEYAAILSYTLAHLGQGWHAFRLEAGVLSYLRKEDRSEARLNFTNLVKHIICEDQKDWPDRIARYINRLTIDRKVLDPIIASFDAAKDYLTVRLHAQSVYDVFPNGTEGYILKEVIPEMYAALAIDLPEQFHILQKDEIAHWDIDKDELFWTAYANLSDRVEQIKVGSREMDGVNMITLFDRDYSAAYVVDFANSCGEWVGRMGSIVAIPAKGSVFIHPIQDSSAFNGAFGKMAELTNKFFREDPGPLTNNVYWFHHNRFELFPKVMEGHSLTYNIPNRLLAYLKTPLASAVPLSDLKDTLLAGDWEGFYEYEKGFSEEIAGSRKSFQMTLMSKGGQLEGTSTDEEHDQPAGIWGFAHQEMISFIKKYPAKIPGEIYFKGIYDAVDVSFSGTWQIDHGQGRVSSGNWTMIKL